jgi:hypothetical protein
MKKITILILVSIFCIKCEKSGDNSKFDNVDIINKIDFVLEPSSDPYEPTKDSFNLDIDHDKIPDITFFVFSYSLGHESTYNSRIKVLNDYEIAIQKANKYDASNSNEDQIYVVVDSALVEIPKICNNLDTISNQLTYTSAILDLAYSHSDGFQLYRWGTYITGWNDIGEKYIVLSNKTNNVYCWVKINVSGYSTITLNSFSYSIDKDFLIIKD